MISHGAIELGNTIHSLECNKPKGFRVIYGQEPVLKGYIDKVEFIKDIVDSIEFNSEFDAYCYGCDTFVHFGGKWYSDIFKYTCPSCKQYHLNNTEFPEDVSLFLKYNKERINLG